MDMVEVMWVIRRRRTGSSPRSGSPWVVMTGVLDVEGISLAITGVNVHAHSVAGNDGLEKLEEIEADIVNISQIENITGPTPLIQAL
jgi:hypothetical protein